MPEEIIAPKYDAPEKPTLPEKTVFSAFEGGMAALMLLFGFGFIKFVLAGGLGIAAAIFFVLFMAASASFISNAKIKPKLSNYVVFGVVLIFAASLGLFDNVFIKVLNLFFVIGGTAYWIYSACYGIESINPHFFYDFMSSLFGVPFGSMGKAPSAINSVCGKSKAAGKGKTILLGLLITIPLTFIVGLLLMSADFMFEHMINKVLDFGFSDVVVLLLQFGLGVPIAFYLFGMLWGNSHKIPAHAPDEKKHGETREKMRFAQSLMTCSAVTPICILYALYFIAQSAYFLSAFQNVLPEGYSYAEYARRGFFELFAVAVINLGIIIFMQLFTKRNEDGKIPVSLRVYTSIISVFTLMLIASALSKMAMYIQEYGLTQMRVYVSWFMVLIALIFLMIIIRQFAPKLNLAKGIVYTFVAMFAILNFSNVDCLIARYNVNAYLSGQTTRMDVYMFYDLSPSAAEYALPLLDAEDSYVADKALEYLAETYEEGGSKDYRAVSYAEYRVHNILGQYEEIVQYRAI